MDLTRKNKGRPPGSKNNLPANQKAEIVFNDLFKTFKDDLIKATPGERLSATTKLAGYLLTSQKEQNEKSN